MSDEFEAGAHGKPPLFPVGYKKPPSHTRFKPGASGNAKGRPKGSRNFSTVIDRELNARIEVSENGKRRRITKREAIVKQTVNKAAAGDSKATNILLNEVRYHEAAAQPSVSHTELTAAADLTVMKNILDRIRQSQPPVADPKPVQEPACEDSTTTSNPVLTEENSDVV